MATEGGLDTTRTTVKTYVPAYQRDTWDEHAEELDMSRSEFVRTMVQAGRRGFDPDADHADGPEPGGEGADTAADSEENDEEADGPVDRSTFETRVLEALSANAYLSWEDLLEAVTADIEEELEDTLQSLQAENLIRYSGPNGGYTIDDE